MESIKPSKKVSRYQSENAGYWKKHIESLKISGLSRKDYCESNNVNYDRFGYWQGRLSRASSSLVPVQLKTRSESSAQDLLCTLILPNGSYLKVHQEYALSIILERFS